MLRAASARKKTKHVRHRGDLVIERAEIRLAAIERLEPRELGCPRLDRIGEFEQQVRAILRHGLRPRGKRAARSRNGRLNLIQRCLGNPCDDVARRGVQDILYIPGPGYKFATDQKAGLQGLFHRSGSLLLEEECEASGAAFLITLGAKRRGMQRF